jgi:restriction system protein
MSQGRQYRRLMLGKGSKHAADCFAGNFVGADFDVDEDLTGQLPDAWKEFNKTFIPKVLAAQPDKTKIGAGLICGSLWVVCKGMNTGDIVICPDGEGTYRVGEITGEYQYVPGGILQHRRPVRWLNVSIPRTAMSEALRNSTGSIGTVCDISGHHDELARLIGNTAQPQIIATDETIEDPMAFAMESHLEHFIVENWEQTDFGQEFIIFEEDGEQTGKQYDTPAGRMDIVAVSKDRKKLLIIELKRGRTSDIVVGQLLRYMGFAKEQMAEPGQEIHGVVIALEDDQKLRWAMSAMPNVAFYRYQISFKLQKVK